MTDSPERKAQKAACAARYRQRMLADGKRQYSYWLTPEQKQAVEQLLSKHPA